MDALPLVSPKIDLAFRLIFGSTRHPKQLLDLVNAVLEAFNEPLVTQITVEDSVLKAQHMTDKMAVLDVKAKTEQGEPINIEMQIIDQNDWEKRSLLYWSRLYSEQIERGEDYCTLKKTISISLLDFKLFERERMYSLYEIQERLDHEPLSNLLQMYFIELPKTDKQIPAHLSGWVRFFNIEDSADVENLPPDNIAIQEACAMLDKISKDPVERALIEARRKALLDYNTNMRGAREKGLAEGRKVGIEEGREEATRKAAIKLKQAGIERELIFEATGLSLDEIDRL